MEKGVIWDDYTIQYFQQENIYQIIDLVIKQLKPVYLGIFGPSGNGKTSVLINLLSYLFKKYSPKIKFTPETFHYYYWLGHSVTLDPRIVVQFFREELGIPKDQDVFLVIEEAESVVPSDRATSNQNKDARLSLDTLRANKIHIIFVAINIEELDRRIVNGKLVLRLQVLYNNIKLKSIKYNALVWGQGYYFKNREYTERKGWILFAENQFMKWSREDMYNVAHEMKEGKIYGDDISAYITSNEAKEFELDRLKEDSKDELIEQIQQKFEKEFQLDFEDRIDREDNINIIINNLLVPIIRIFKEKKIKVTNTELEAIIKTTDGVPTTGIFWRTHIATAKKIA